MHNLRDKSLETEIPFRLHPRIFEALGAQLVTNDVVAVLELVKNSYDAMATRVNVNFHQIDKSGGMSLEIIDNGIGMTRDIIENVWAVVATPYRHDRPVSKHKGKTRRVSGEKGLGRLSAARLGNDLELMTKAGNEPCWQLRVSWDQLVAAESLDTCTLNIKEYLSEWKDGTGTLVRITHLKNDWFEDDVGKLKDQLARLISPFSGIEDFEIWFRSPFEESDEPIEIKPPEFLSYPPYKISGCVNEKGWLQAQYHHVSPTGERDLELEKQLEFPDYVEAVENGADLSKLKTACGPFEFEIRAWDLDTDSIQNIAERFDAKRTTIRNSIREYKGISLYRDGILVLPKTDSARDWLGLDLRRVSRTGTRLSTSQLIGYISISADRNSNLRDKSDRERLEDNQASKDFEDLVTAIIKELEEKRSEDRQAPDYREAPFKDLFENLRAEELVNQVQSLADRNVSAREAIPYVEDHKTQVDKTIDQIERRLYYYSRLASLGTLSAMIMHEVRNHTTALGRFTRNVRRWITKVVEDTDLLADLDLAEKSIRALERLADRFAPLASRALRTRRRDSILEETVIDILALRENELKRKKIEVLPLPQGKTRVPVDPGELSTILLNLVDNSIYWLARSKPNNRKIGFQVEKRENFYRVIVRVDDSGPGIPDGEEERVFWPGVTSKPEGLGMGLTVAAEIVSQYGGRLYITKPGFLGGASFGFDLPMKE
jgi:signal transduction histidine kinase